MARDVIRNDLFPASMRTVDGIKWGYINNKGKFAIVPQFEDVSEFQQSGLAIVRKNGHAGIIDRYGRFVVQPTIMNYTIWIGISL